MNQANQMVETNILRGTENRTPCSHSPSVLWQIDARGVFCGGCQDYVYLSIEPEVHTSTWTAKCSNCTTRKKCKIHACKGCGARKDKFCTCKEEYVERLKRLENTGEQLEMEGKEFVRGYEQCRTTILKALDKDCGRDKD